jgi:hypothetical protein
MLQGRCDAFGKPPGKVLSRSEETDSRSPTPTTLPGSEGAARSLCTFVASGPARRFPQKQSTTAHVPIPMLTRMEGILSEMERGDLTPFAFDKRAVNREMANNCYVQ